LEARLLRRGAGLDSSGLEHKGVEKGSVPNALLEAVFQPFELKGIIRFKWDGIRVVPVEGYLGFASKSETTVGGSSDPALSQSRLRGLILYQGS
jgi:hypothetical protein